MPTTTTNPRTIAYLRVSTVKQDLENQKLAILEHCQANRIHVDEWFELESSSRKSLKERRVDELLSTLQEGDTLIVSELSRLGRSLSQIVLIVDALVSKRVQFIAIKQNMRFNGKMDMTTKIQLAMFGIMAEIERDLISERTKMGLERARAEGKLLGRPKGSGHSSLDGRADEIRGLLAKGVSKASIARILDVGYTTLNHWIRTRIGK